MDNTETSTTICGVKTVPLQRIMEVVKWVLSGSQRPREMTGNFQWAVVQCTDAFCWALLKEEGWVLGIEPGQRPPTAERLLELRVFGDKNEALIWKSEDGFSGRLSIEIPVSSSFFAPVESFAPFQGAESPGEIPDGFVIRSTEAGRTIVSPLGTGVSVFSHLQEDTETGALRIALIRMSRVK